MFTIIKDTKTKVTAESVSENDGISVYKINIKFLADKTENVTLCWEEDMTDIYSVWDPVSGRDRGMRQWFNPNRVESRLCHGAPVLACLDNKGRNRITAALSDTVNACEIAFCIDDLSQKDKVRFTLTLLKDMPERKSEYSTLLRIDKRNVPFYEAVQSVAKWWEDLSPIQKTVPVSAELSLYSSWYNFHQQPEEDLLLRELQKASELGFKTVIVDDGWQFDGKGSGNYINCGDWRVSPAKFGNFADFVRKVHALGMKVMLWFPVPFVGYNTDDYLLYKDKMLYNSDDANYRAGVIDVRYKEMRAYIVNTYKRFVTKYDLDGLKLDFIDSFMLKENSPAYNPQMDCKTADEAVLKLLTEIRNELTAIKNDILIEFRQKYIGAEILRYCNMLRVHDCAFDSVTNRIGIADLRLLSRNTAIHSDMLLWAKNERAENCARQLINILFSVPQLSVLFTQSTPEQIALVQRYIAYWTENREILLRGNFKAYNPEANYSVLSSENERKKITALYAKNACVYSGKEEDIFNATDEDTVYIENRTGKSVCLRVFDCMGELLQEKVASDTVVKVRVPLSGLCRIRIKNEEKA